MNAGHLMENYGQRVLTMERGQGVYLFDSEGRRYLDYTAGIAVCSLGHAHPAVTDALVLQANTLIHCSNLYETAAQNRLANRLSELSGLDKVFFCNSGAEANEAAMKLARRFFANRGDSTRTKIVSLPGGFHGRTYGALSLTRRAKYQEGFTPLVPDCVTPDDLHDVVETISRDTAACFVEIIQGEGGVRPIPDRLLHDIAARCREVGALLIVDEIQTGIGRTGTFLAYEQIGIQPDVVTLAKGLANGVPIGAVLARDEVAEAFRAGTHGSTFGGNLLAMAAANTVVDLVSTQAFLLRVQEVGAYLGDELHRIGEDVSGKGLMWGISVPDSRSFVDAAARQGVLVTAVGEHRVRFVPPLILEHAHVDEMIARLSILV